MLTFKDHKAIYESVFIFYESVGNWEQHRDWWHTHHTKIDGHKIKVHYFNIDSNNWRVDFSSDSSFQGHNKSMIDTSTRHKMLRFVGNSVNSFIQKHKPNELHISPNHPSKKGLYSAYAKSLAKRYGGKTEMRQSTNVVKFTGNEK